MTSTPSLISFPAELKLLIIAELGIEDKLRLRLVCHTFYSFIPKPTRGDLVLLWDSIFGRQNNLQVCFSCRRLRPKSAFSTEIRTNLGFRRQSIRSNGLLGNRFCNECGSRPLPGIHRYQLGEIWHQDGMSYLRCTRCEECKPFTTKTRARCYVSVCSDCAMVNAGVKTDDGRFAGQWFSRHDRCLHQKALQRKKTC